MFEEVLTDDEFIEDILIRAFVMMLGVSTPPLEVLQYMQSWVKIQAKNSNSTITEEFVLKQIPAYITHLQRR
jgi:hypothetical protein